MSAEAAVLDTVIVDVDVPTFKRPRVPTEDLTMQVSHDGFWHRRLTDLSATSCGSRFNSQFTPVRREELRHPLCPGCFTPVELAIADKVELAEVDP